MKTVITIIISLMIVICSCVRYPKLVNHRYDKFLDDNKYRVDSLGFLDGEIYYLSEDNELEKIEFSHGFYKSYSRKILYSNGKIRSEIGELYCLNYPLKYNDLRLNDYHLSLGKKYLQEISFKKNYTKKGKLSSVFIDLNDTLHRQYSFYYFNNQDSTIQNAQIKGLGVDTAIWFNKEKKIKRCIIRKCENKTEETENQYFICKDQEIEVNKDLLDRLNFKYFFDLFNKIDSLKPYTADNCEDISPVLPNINK